MRPTTLPSHVLQPVIEQSLPETAASLISNLLSSLNKITSHFSPHHDYRCYHLNGYQPKKKRKIIDIISISDTAGANQRSFWSIQVNQKTTQLYRLNQSPHAVSRKGGTSHTCTGGVRSKKVGVHGFCACVCVKECECVFEKGRSKGVRHLSDRGNVQEKNQSLSTVCLLVALSETHKLSCTHKCKLQVLMSS